MPSCNTYHLTWVSLNLGVGYLLTAALPDLQRGIAPLGPPVTAQPRRGVGPPGRAPGLGRGGVGYLLPAAAPDLGRGVTPLVAAPDLGHWVSPLGRPPPLPGPRTWGSSSRPFLRRRSLALLAAAPDLGRGITPLGRRPSGMGSSRLLPLTSDVG